MKRIAAVVLALGLVFAVGATSAEAAKPDKAAKQAAKADKAGKRNKDAVAGTVLKIENNTITLQGRGKNGAESVVQTDDKTKFEGVASLADIKPGMRVMVTPNTGTAEKVIVRQQPGAAGGKGAKKLKNK
jgi:hypothetical protein